LTVDITVYTREMLVRDFAAYLTYERGASHHTISNYRNDLKKLDAFLPAGKPWQDVDRADLRALLQSMSERGYSLRSVRRVVACLRSFYKFLRMEGHIDRAAVDDLPRMKVPQVLPRFLEWEDVEKLIQTPLRMATKSEGGGQAVAHRNHAIFELLAATGMRIGEAQGLRLGDLSLDDTPVVRVFGKGSKERVIPMHDDAALVLMDYIEHHRPKLSPQSDHLFVTDKGTPLSRESFYYSVRRYAKAAKISQRVYPHLIRHSFATAMVKAGMPLPVLQELLGHASISTTAIYTHVSAEHLRTAYLAFHPGGR
jgi:integrase/recombinase XerD